MHAVNRWCKLPLLKHRNKEMTHRIKYDEEVWEARKGSYFASLLIQALWDRRRDSLRHLKDRYVHNRSRGIAALVRLWCFDKHESFANWRSSQSVHVCLVPRTINGNLPRVNLPMLNGTNLFMTCTPIVCPRRHVYWKVYTCTCRGHSVGKVWGYNDVDITLGCAVGAEMKPA